MLSKEKLYLETYYSLASSIACWSYVSEIGLEKYWEKQWKSLVVNQMGNHGHGKQEETITQVSDFRKKTQQAGIKLK